MGSYVKRLAGGRRDGVAVIAEGVILGIAPGDLKHLEDVEHDDHGHLRLAEVNFGDILRDRVRDRLEELGLYPTIVAKNVGYELRCADPVPLDMEYARDLGYCASQWLLNGGNASIITINAGRFVPIPFETMLDTAQRRARIRDVDIRSARYLIARRYMIRLLRDDFADDHALARYAATCGLSLEEFRAQFEELVRDEPEPIVLEGARST